MKIIKQLALFLILALTISCSDNNEPIQKPTTIINNLEGTWKLTRVFVNFADFEYGFPAGVINWTFNESEQKIIVVNNNIDLNLKGILESGTYPYEIINNSGVSELCSKSIKIDGVSYGCIRALNNVLTIDPSTVDLQRIELVK